MKKIDFKSAWRPTLAAWALALGACASYRSAVPPAPQPVKPPQVVYRIDDHRYFELTPDETCFGNMLYFIDTAKGIRSEVVIFDAVMNRTTLIIDAANDQYLVAPVTRGGINCSSGGGACGGDKMPYSTDGGKTWKRVYSPGTTYDLMVSGPHAYQSWHRPAYGTTSTDALDLTNDITATGGVNGPLRYEAEWKPVKDFTFQPRIAPVDTKVRCSAKPEGSRP
uniref:T6SS immunity protein Tli3 family protein n=1 Tax=unclassified Variovorax TaxID=663243 RepID=UPI000D4CB42B